jgi:TonB family protein
MTNLRRSAAVCGLALALLSGFLPVTQAQDLQGNAPLQESSANLVDLAASMAARIQKSCKGEGCTVVVGDFTFANGKTSKFGKQLAEDLFTELSRHNLRMVDQHILRDFLERDRLQVDYEHRTFLRWILETLHIRFMILGTAENLGYGAVRVVGEIVDGHSKNYVLYKWGVHLRTQDAQTDLAPISTLGRLAPLTDANGVSIGDAKAGDTRPRCMYMPNPPYTDAARKEKLSGVVTVEAIINPEGRLENMRILKGMPLGLNERSLKTMRTWRCSPAMRDGQPIPVRVTFEVNFRMY